MRRLSLDALRDLNELQAKELGSPETATRIAQYEMAFRMQVAVPEVMDITKETKETIERVRRPAGRRELRQQLPAGPPAGREGRALRAALRLGLGLPRHRPRRGHQDRPAGALQEDGPAGGGADPRPEVARPAGRDAGGLDRRVRPHAVPRGPHRRQRQPRPRPSSVLLHDVHGRRRPEAGRHLRRVRRAGLLRRRRTRSTSTICRRRSCTCSASTTSG